jgi:hypothetical protein
MKEGTDISVRLGASSCLKRAADQGGQPQPTALSSTQHNTSQRTPPRQQQLCELAIVLLEVYADANRQYSDNVRTAIEPFLIQPCPTLGCLIPSVPMQYPMTYHEFYVPFDAYSLHTLFHWFPADTYTVSP